MCFVVAVVVVLYASKQESTRVLCEITFVTEHSFPVTKFEYWFAELANRDGKCADNALDIRWREKENRQIIASKEEYEAEEIRLCVSSVLVNTPAQNEVLRYG